MGNGPERFVRTGWRRRIVRVVVGRVIAARLIIVAG
jgi:hypothetical protein